LNKTKVVTIEDRIPKLKEKRKQKANRRLIFYLSCFFIMILSVVYFQSPLSKVAEIKITGNENVSNEEILELSKLSTSTSFWKVQTDQVNKQIESHNEITNSNVSRGFPNKIVIDVNELARVAYTVDSDGKFFPILENGNILDPVNKIPNISDAPLLVNWQQSGDIVGFVAELNKLPKSIVNSISEIHYAPSESDPLHIQLYMNNGYEVSATIRGFAEKMLAYPAVIGGLDPAKKGIIHLDVVPFFKEYQNESVNVKEGDEIIENEG
jgi:cell division protein FtsQ